VQRKTVVATAVWLLAAGLSCACAARRQPVVVDAGIVPVEQRAAPAATQETTQPAGATLPDEPTLEPPPAPTPEPASADATEDATVEAAAARPASEPRPKPSLRDLCRQGGDSDGFLDDSRRLLAETFCGATLWFDGLFGGSPDVTSARAVSGRLELSGLHTDFRGFDQKARLRLNYELPNLERRVRLFLGRDDPELIADRQEGFAIRSSVFGLEDREEWLAGLGYRPPGRFLKRVDFGVGARVKMSPEVFVQARYRQNFFLGRNDVWRLRETVFYENRDKFGSTTSLDWDRVLRQDLLARWGNVGTISGGTEGLEWRSALVLYHNLRRSRAIAGEVFWRGATGADVRLREYGARGIYRQPLYRKRGELPFFYGDLIAGYTWPREEKDEPREGSLMLGVGFELLFGQQPY